jgi:hypothetical protein
VISGAPEGLAVPAPFLTPAGNIISMIFDIKTVCSRQLGKCTKNQQSNGRFIQQKYLYFLHSYK